MVDRVVAFVDGFNLYHALKATGKNHLKWLDLSALCQRYVRPRSESLSGVQYFTAYATWLAGPYRRHQQYVAALEALGVKVVLGHFKKKEVRCKVCGRRFHTSEEKQTDVNIAVQIVRLAAENAFDKALVVTADSDIAPAIAAMREMFPTKSADILTPPGSGRVTDLLEAAHGPNWKRVPRLRMKENHVAECLLPEIVSGGESRGTIHRPHEYDPP